MAAAAIAAVLFCAIGAHAGQRRHSGGYQLSGGPLAHVTHEVDLWERAYQRRDKQTLIMKLLVTTKDADKVEQRYQWLRGYGPTDMPGTVHPPILFDRNKGSFHPTQYALMKTTKISPAEWDNTVQEKGTYHDEEGDWMVTRVRHITVVKVGANYYVKNYYLEDNPDAYGFGVDDIKDKMTKAQ
jgi:hypothetical protein